MTYYSVRVFIIFMFLLAMILLMRKGGIFENSRIPTTILSLIISFFIIYIPFEINSLTFDSYKSAFNYSFPFNRFISAKEYDNYALVLNKNSQDEYIIYDFYKDNKKWKFRYPFRYKKDIYKNGNIIIDKYLYEDNLAVLIVNINNETGDTLITDNYSSNFRKLESDDNNKKIYYAVIHDYKTDYEININNTILSIN